MENPNHVKFSALEVQLQGWLANALSGDSNSYLKFLSTLTPYLRGFFRKRMQFCPDQVEDLIQEVLLAIHVKQHTYDARLPISAWIHAIAKYKYIDFLRRRNHTVDHESIDESSEVFGFSDAAAQEARRDLGKLLNSLPDSYRIPIQLTKLDGYSVREASKICGVSESAIKIGVHRGLKKLALELGCNYEY